MSAAPDLDYRVALHLEFERVGLGKVLERLKHDADYEVFNLCSLAHTSTRYFFERVGGPVQARRWP